MVLDAQAKPQTRPTGKPIVNDFALTAATKASPNPIRNFIVTGESKRGWTTWTTAAVDSRVVAIAPLVIDVLNLEVSMQHHWDAYGYWAPAVQDYVEGEGFSVVRDLVGHGVGRQLHEEPSVPNFGTRGTGIVLEEGMTLAIEPMVNVGTYEVRLDDDGWTVRTGDGKPSAHFEHTIVVRKGEAEILTR